MNTQGKAASRDVLFISRQRLVGATNGSSVYLLDLAQALRDAGMRPHLLQPSPTLMGRYPFLRLKPEMWVFESHAIRGVLKFGDLVISPDPRIYLAAALGVASRLVRKLGVGGAWAKDRPMAYGIALPWTAADHAFIAKAAKGKAEVVIADYMFQTAAFADLANVPSAIVMHDLFHARDSDADSVSQVTREAEIAMLAKADVVIAIQATEAGFIDANVPGTRAILAPMAAHPDAEAKPGDPDRLLFVGSNTAPNVEGLKWLFEQVWPTVLAAWPQARLDIAGTVAWAFPAGGPQGVRFLGLVDDLGALYDQAGVVISPLTFGSGLKIKLIEAMAKGKAIVATSITLQGVEAECEGAVARADEPAKFAAHILDLHGDSAARFALAEQALKAAREHFSPQACYGAFVEWARTAVAAKS